MTLAPSKIIKVKTVTFSPTKQRYSRYASISAKKLDLIQKTMKDNNYNTIKTIKSLIENNISFQQLKLTSNLNMIESIKERHHLVSVLSQWNKFTFCDLKDIRKSCRDSHSEIKFPTNLFVKHIYDFNSQRSILMSEQDKNDNDNNNKEAFNCFKLLKSNSSNDLQINNLKKVYHNDENEDKKQEMIEIQFMTDDDDFGLKVKHKIQMQKEEKWSTIELLRKLICDYKTKTFLIELYQIAKAWYKYTIHRREHNCSFECSNITSQITITPTELNHSSTHHITQTNSLIKTYNTNAHKYISEKSSL